LKSGCKGKISSAIGVWEKVFEEGCGKVVVGWRENCYPAREK